MANTHLGMWRTTDILNTTFGGGGSGGGTTNSGWATMSTSTSTTTGDIYLTMLSDQVVTLATTVFYPGMIAAQQAAQANQHATMQQQMVARGVQAAQQLTAAEAAQQLARREEARAAADADKKKREAAAERAKGLLLSNLTPAQRTSFDKNKWFVVEGGKTKKRYRIHVGQYAGNIYELRDGVTEDGAAAATLCCHIGAGNIPSYDHHLAQKLMLESNEAEFLKLANRRAA